MILNNRKIKILEAIITNYIQSGEPISSRNIAKNYDLGISSATIRNEMSDLEEIGLIIQPHTSSGRIPSDKGYRLYVDTLMGDRELTNEEAEYLQSIVVNNINHMDYLMEQTARALSMLTNYPTIVSRPAGSIQIKKVQLIPFDDKTIIAVFITKSKTTKSCPISTSREFVEIDLLCITSTINDMILKYTIQQIEKIIDQYDESDISEETNIIKKVFNEILKLLIIEDTKIYTSGINNILNFKEFAGLEETKNIFKALEEKEILIDILGAETINSNSIQILIGGENNVDQLKNCSVVKTEYKIDGVSGTIGIIAPTRMDYAKAVSILNALIKNINDIIKNISP